MVFRWIRSEKRGYTGGEYFHLEKEDEWVPLEEVAEEKIDLDSKRAAYGVDTSDSRNWFSIDFTSNPKNRNFRIRRFVHGDFQSSKPVSFRDYDHPDPRDSDVAEKLAYDEILRKVRRTKKFVRRQKVIEKVRPKVKNLFACSEYTRASPGVKQALDSPLKFFVSAAGQGRGGTKAIGNVKKYLQQAYEVEAIRRGLNAEVERGELRRRWTTGGSPPGNEDLSVSYSTLERLGIGFGKPNLILSSGSAKYSIWVEFPFSEYCRPDLFILKGEHNSAFMSSVRSYLNEYDPGFYDEVIKEWEEGIARAFGKKTSGGKGPKEEEIKEFLRGLSRHLKKGVVIESKEEPGEKEEAQRQIQRYKDIFSGQKIVLLTWFEWKWETSSGVKYLDEFDVDESSARKLVALVRNSTG